MSIFQFPEDLHVQLIESDPVLLGGFSLTPTQTPGDLEYIRTRVYVHNVVPSNAQVRLVVYNDPSQHTEICSSEWRSLSEIDGYMGSWLGDLSFQMSPNPPLDSNTTIYVYLETNNYTYLENQYISIVFGYPFNTYAGQDNRLVGKAELFIKA